jgi:hypothetical protein
MTQGCFRNNIFHNSSSISKIDVKLDPVFLPLPRIYYRTLIASAIVWISYYSVRSRSARFYANTISLNGRSKVFMCFASSFDWFKSEK